MNKNNLPIGTVVLLKGGLKKIMITGRSSVSRDDSEKVYDYNGCIFPEGIMENVFSLFDADQIEEVLYIGMKPEVEYNGPKYTNYGKADYGTVEEQGGFGRKISTKGRTPKAPTNPMSLSEMKAKFTVAKQSGIDGTE